jgi:hypothetical protein
MGNIAAPNKKDEDGYLGKAISYRLFWCYVSGWS